MEPETCMKMLKNFTEKLRAKLPTTTHGYSMVKSAHLNDAFSEIFELEASPVEVQSLQLTFIHSFIQQRRGRQRKGTKN